MRTYHGYFCKSGTDEQVVSDIEIDEPWSLAAVVLTLWTIVSIVTAIVLPAALSPTVKSGVAGGISFILSVQILSNGLPFLQ